MAYTDSFFLYLLFGFFFYIKLAFSFFFSRFLIKKSLLCLSICFLHIFSPCSFFIYIFIICLFFYLYIYSLITFIYFYLYIHSLILSIYLLFTCISFLFKVCFCLIFFLVQQCHVRVAGIAPNPKWLGDLWSSGWLSRMAVKFRRPPRFRLTFSDDCEVPGPP
jgi:hypothetical protein